MKHVEINGSDTETLHLFHLDLPPEAVERFTTMAGTGEWPLKYALGATALRPAFVETVRISDLGPMPLSRYLAEAHGLSETALAADRATLDAMTGHVVILPPQAFDNTTQTLSPAAPLTHVGAYGGPAPKGRGAPLRSAGAEGSLTGKTPDGAGRGSGTLLKLLLAGIAVVILLVLLLALR
ncbi:hypothetical protein [Ponticoccus alexandrii]|uniref:Aspartate carbamoyltransferase catalytic subunit n=1 Tax=Ponticoccus alexandrii TaxID=1943633 RepID=A0ABX7FBY4_9RHOB|nr:hypothetical protein [Ponticoccus alexandrii]ETA51819.1 aspartate carbamoyltransferase catalytic subunit [Rhodobacteraceae bacterium PD-2]QRF67999.1 aspartate carbamoyltransferase catalytic subunit [Ponticoccus alexandrii]